MKMKPLMVNNIKKGQQGLYKGKQVFVFDCGLDMRQANYTKQKTLTILDDMDVAIWTSNSSRLAFDSTRTAVLFAKGVIDNL